MARYPLCRRLGGPWTGAENSPPPEFDLRTVQPVASRCSCRLRHSGRASGVDGSIHVCCKMQAIWRWQSVVFCSVLFCSVLFSVVRSVHFRSIFAPTCSLYFRPFTLSVDIAATNVPTRILHKFFSFPFLLFLLLSFRVFSMRVAVCSVRPIHYFLRVFVVRFSFEVFPITQCRRLRNNAVNILIQTSQLHTSNNNTF